MSIGDQVPFGGERRERAIRWRPDTFRLPDRRRDIGAEQRFDRVDDLTRGEPDEPSLDERRLGAVVVARAAFARAAGRAAARTGAAGVPADARIPTRRPPAAAPPISVRKVGFPPTSRSANNEG